MAGTPESSDGMITGINVTPLVDVVLVLLIIFMATAPMISKRALNVSVPKSAQGERKATATLQLYFSADRSIQMEKESLTADDLEAALRQRVAGDPALHVSVAADQTIPYGDVVGLLDVVKRAGVKKVALDVRAK